ncbi:MAG: glycosyltransferase family 39 protein [Acidobacteria bacterium]|nr:glycosyltransferase family 39 protein [Acidobacteriota bacterium]
MRLPAFFQRRRSALVSVFLLVLVVGILQWHWLLEYRVFDLPPRWDEAMYHARSVKYHVAIDSDGAEGFWKVFTNPDEPRPPLLPVSTLVFAPLGPYQLEYGHLTIMLYLAVLCVATYFIGENLVGPAGGLFSVLYLLFFRSTLVYSKAMLSDLPAAALITLAMLCLLKSNWNDRTLWNVALGVAIGLAMNARNFAGVYLILPLLYAFYRGLRRHGLIVIVKLLPGVAVSLALMYPWYIHHLDALTAFFSRYLYGAYAQIHLEHEVVDFFSVGGFESPPGYYARGALFVGPSLLFGSLLISLSAAAAVSIWKRRGPTREGAVLMAFWGLGSLVILSSISNVSLNYLMPIMPALALSIEYLAWKLDVGRAARVFAMIPILAHATTFFTAPVGFELADTIRQVYPEAEEGRPINPDWRVSAILQELERREGLREMRIGIVGSHPFFSGNAFRLEVVRRDLPYTFIEPLLSTDADVKTCLAASDYIITKTGLQIPSSAAFSPESLKSSFDTGFLRYEQLPKDYALPDSSIAMIFRHLPDVRRIRTGDLEPYPGARVFPAADPFLGGRTSNPVSVVYENGMGFLGAHLEPRYGWLFARLFWHVLSPQSRIGTFVHFIEPGDGSGAPPKITFGDDHVIENLEPGSSWLPGDYITEGRVIREHEGFERVTGIALGLLPDAGEGRIAVRAASTVVDDWNTRAIVPLELTGRALPPDLRDSAGTELVRKPVSFGDSLVLASCRLHDLDTATPVITYVWRCISKITVDDAFFVHFTNADGSIVFQNDHQPMDGKFPTRQWRPGEWIRESYQLHPPEGVRLGALDVRIGVDPRMASTGPLRVLTPDVKTDWEGRRLILRRH